MKIHDTIAQVLKSKNIDTVLSIGPDDTVYDALKLMAEHDVGALLVLSDGELSGILSERDYARKGVLLGHPSRETRVSQMMTSPVVFVSPEHTVDECLETMTPPAGPLPPGRSRPPAGSGSPRPRRRAVARRPPGPPPDPRRGGRRAPAL